MKNFFERQHDKSYETNYVPLIKDKINAYNLESFSKKQILKFFQLGDEINFLAYRFDILKQWIRNNERYTKRYIDELEEIVSKLSLDSELNGFERQYIMDVNSVSFAKTRNLKQLIVDFSMNDKELVFYRYEIDKFNEIKNNTEFTVLNECDFYITTQRIIISKQIDIISIGFDQIKRYQFKRDRITFYLKNDRAYCIKSDNNYVLYASLERILKREKIMFNK